MYISNVIDKNIIANKVLNDRGVVVTKCTFAIKKLG